MGRKLKQKKISNPQSADLLYRIAKAMGAVKDGRELLKIIVEYVQPIFGFHDIGLSVLDKSGEYFSDWTILYEEISPSAGNLALREAEQFKISVDEPLYKYGFARAQKEGKPFIDNMTPEFIEKFGDFSHINSHIEQGCKQFLVTTLKFRGETFGMLNFNSQRENQFDDCDFELFQAIADLVAVAVANITANEEILERAREKEKLLSISREIAKVQNRQQLLHVIFTAIRDILPYDDAGLFYFCDRNGKPKPDGEHYVHLLDDLVSEVNAEIAEQNITGVLSERIDSVRFVAQNETLTTTLDELIERFPGHPFFPIMQHDGIRQFISKGIKVGGETIGMLSFNSRQENFYTEADFPLFDSIADQVAVAVSNILANEEILEREKEKSQLLAISEQLATIRDKHDLFEVIFGELKPIFNFDDCVVALYDENLEHTRHIHSTIKGEQLGNPHYQAIMSEKVSTENNPHGEFIGYDAPRIVTLEYFLEHYPHHVGVQTMKDFGLLECVIMPLRYGGRLLGTLEFHSTERGRFTESQMPLCRNLADQMGVAISNILANEEIARLSEDRRERAEELARTNGALQRSTLRLTSVENIEHFIHGVLTEIIKEAKAEGSAVFQVTADGERLQMTHYVEGSRLIDIATDSRFEVWRETKPFLGNAASEKMLGGESIWADYSQGAFPGDWEEAFPFHQMMGHKRVAGLPLLIGGENIGFLAICFAEVIKPSESKMQLCKTLTQHAALALHFTRLADAAKETTIAREQEKAARTRADELAKSNEALARTSAHLAEQPDLNAFLGQIVIEACRQLNADAGHLMTLDEKRGVFQTAALIENGLIVPGESMAEEIPLAESKFWFVLRETMKPRYFDIEKEPEFFWRGSIEYLRAHNHKSVVAFPVIAGNKILGVMGIAFRRTELISEQQSELIDALAHQAALAIQLSRLSDEARCKAEESAVLGERNRIAREIHDTLAQSFTGIIIQLEAGKRILPAEPDETARHLERASSLAREGLTEARRSVQALRPLALEQTDLATTLERFLERMIGGTEITGEFAASGTPAAPFAPEVNDNLLRIAQEAVTNAVRHAAPRRIFVQLNYRKNTIELLVTDDGCGFDTEIAADGFGLIGMRERARSAGAELKIKSRSGRGTEITATFEIETPLINRH